MKQHSYTILLLLILIFTGGNSATLERTVTTPTLTDLSLESNITTLNVGETVELTVIATNSDGSSKELDVNVEYIITHTDRVEVNDSVLTVNKDGNVTVQAKVNGVLSNTLNLTIAWVVNGYVLPPEPDKTLNDSTLLGVDSNNNGVRDDVERWILRCRWGRAYKLVLETPEKARAIYHEVDKAAYCEVYYKIDAELVGESLLITEDIDSQYFRHKIYFNSKERLDAYLQYDTLLSAYTYVLPNIEDEKKACNFNTDKYEE